MNAGPPCACGRPKDGRAKKCQNCHNPLWTAAEDRRLAAMIAEGKPHKEIARELSRSLSAVNCRARDRGLKLSREAALANHRTAIREFFSDRSRLETWIKKHRAESLSPEIREQRRKDAHRRIASGDLGFRGGHSEKSRKQMSVSQKRRYDRLHSFAPRGHWLRTEYRKLVKLVGKAEAKRMILQEVDRLPPFEQQLLRVQGGAKVADKFVIPATEYDMTLGGISAGMML